MIITLSIVSAFLFVVLLIYFKTDYNLYRIGKRHGYNNAIEDIKKYAVQNRIGDDIEIKRICAYLKYLLTK